jgi:hypothetical protein
MSYEDIESSSDFSQFNETIKYNHYNSSTNPTEAVLIAFQIGRTISFLCIISGVLGNSALILTISRSSFSHFSYGLLLLFISTFDIIALLTTGFYYLIQGHVISLTLPTITIYITFYRYSKIVTNWLKVFLAVERLVAVKYWIAHRYNINSINAKRINRSRQRKILLLILTLLLCSLISQHPNLIPIRFISTCINPIQLLIINTPNPHFYYGNHVFNGVLFTIISYIIIDDLLPIILLIIFNTILLYELRHLPSITSKKLADSIFILFFLTIFSIFVVPRSFLVVFNLYVNQEYINDTIIAVVSHTCQGNSYKLFFIFYFYLGLEMINHAITGYTCFLSCRTLRKDFIRIVSEKFRRTIPSSSIELSIISQNKP